MAPLAMASDLSSPPAPAPSGDTCASHYWMQEFEGCPYGVAGLGDVTWPDYKKAKALGAVVWDEFDAPPWFLHVCVLWSYVPYFMAALAVVKLLVWNSLWPTCCRIGLMEPSQRQTMEALSVRRHGTKELSYALLLLAIVGGNELLLKRLVTQPRPEMSCLLSCGMPSSHSALAAGTLTMGFLDFCLRCSPRKAVGSMLQVWELRQLSLEEEQRRSSLPVHRTLRQQAKQLLYDSALSLQLAPFDEPSARDFLGYAAIWTCLMAPVPFSRIQLSDHTPTQVISGVACGGLVAATWFSFLHGLQKRYNHLVGRRWPRRAWWAFEHNYALPCYHALVRCNPYSVSPKLGSDSRFLRRAAGGEEGEPPFKWLRECVSELEWYRDQTLQRRAEMLHMETLTKLEDLYLTARHWRLHEVLELLRLELWLLEDALPADTVPAVAKGFCAHLTEPQPRGLGVQSRGGLLRLGPEKLRQSWQESWSEELPLLEALLAHLDGCRRAVAEASPGGPEASPARRHTALSVGPTSPSSSFQIDSGRH